MYNYTKKDLDKFAADTGFIRDNLEKVFRLFEVLQYINENKLLDDHLALKGGTAINLTFFNMQRLSVDIDLLIESKTIRWLYGKLKTSKL